VYNDEIFPLGKAWNHVLGMKEFVDVDDRVGSRQMPLQGARTNGRSLGPALASDH
jgi:hypothetical protein